MCTKCQRREQDGRDRKRISRRLTEKHTGIRCDDCSRHRRVSRLARGGIGIEYSGSAWVNGLEAKPQLVGRREALPCARQHDQALTFG